VAACGDRFLLVDADDPARSRDLVPAGVFPANSSLTLAIALDERHIALIPGRPTGHLGDDAPLTTGSLLTSGFHRIQAP
jgi:hypothetical protein